MSRDSVTAGTGRRSGGRSFPRRTARVFAAGLVGVFGLALTVLLVPDTLPSVPDVPRTVLLVATVVQPAVLVLLAAALGARLAPAVGFRSYLADGSEDGPLAAVLRSEARVAVPAGLVAGVLIVVLDVAFSLATDGATALGAGESATLASVLGSLPLRFLYGGIAEEVLLRWGFMTLVVWALCRVSGRSSRPSDATVWTGIVVAAVVFGAAHLPAVAVEATLTPPLVVRTVALNAVGGIVFGWVFWRYSLEAAMLAHAAAHVALVTPALLAVV